MKILNNALKNNTTRYTSQAHAVRASVRVANGMDADSWRWAKKPGIAQELDMKRNIGIIFLLLLVPAFSYAGSADCEIEIEDINSSVAQKKVTKIKKLETFEFEPGANALTATQRKYFKLPDELYICNLAFVDLQTGTALSCESTKDKGYTYFQSEQGENAGASSKLFLTFRHANSHFTISAICK